MCSIVPTYAHLNGAKHAKKVKVSNFINVPPLNEPIFSPDTNSHNIEKNATDLLPNCKGNFIIVI